MEAKGLIFPNDSECVVSTSDINETPISHCDKVGLPENSCLDD